MKVICVDDERPGRDIFLRIVRKIPTVTSAEALETAEEAIAYIQENTVDTAFLDIQLSGPMNGIELAGRLHELRPELHIVFLTAYADYAMDAFREDAVGYLLKPYNAEDITHALEKAARILPPATKLAKVVTMPHFDLYVNDRVVPINRAKVKELLALLVDRGEHGITSGDAIACLWEDRPSDDCTAGLYRVTFSRLQTLLKENGLDGLVVNDGRVKRIVMSSIDCDLYHVLNGECTLLPGSRSDYMSEYSWAEPTRARLQEISENI